MKEKNRGFGTSDTAPESEAAQEVVFPFKSIMDQFHRDSEAPEAQPPAAAAQEPEPSGPSEPPKASSAPAETGRFDFLGLLKQVQEQDAEASAPLSPQPGSPAQSSPEEILIPVPQERQPGSDFDPSFEDWSALLPSQEPVPAPEEDWTEVLRWTQAPAPEPALAPQAVRQPEPPKAAPAKAEPPQAKAPPVRRPDPRMEKWAEELSFSQKLPAAPGHVPESAKAEAPAAAPVAPAAPAAVQDTLTSIFGDDPVMQYWLRSEDAPSAPSPAPAKADEAPSPAAGASVTDDTLTGLLRDIRAEIGEEPEPPASEAPAHEQAAPKKQEPEDGFRSRWGKRWQHAPEPEAAAPSQEPIRYRMPATMPMKPEAPAKSAPPAPASGNAAEPDWKEDTFQFPEVDDSAQAPERESSAAAPAQTPEPEAVSEPASEEPEAADTDASLAAAPAEREDDDLMARIEQLLQDTPAEPTAPVSDATIRFKPPVQEASAAVDEPTMRFDAVSEPEPPAVRRRVQRPAPEADDRAEAARRPRRQAPPLSAEQRYREASGGLGGALTRIFISLGATVIALALSIAQSAGWIKLSGGVSFPPFVELALLLVCALMAFDVLADGLGQLAGRHFTLNTLAVLATVLSIIDGVASLIAGAGTYCPLACLLLLSAQWGLYLNRRARAATMDVARRGGEQGEALAREYSVLGKRPGLLRGEWNSQRFLAANEALPLPERILRWYAAAVPLVSLVCAIAFGGGKAQVILHNWTAILLAGTPVLLFVTVWRPWSILSRQLQRCGAALAGWQGVELLCGKLAFPITDEDLFPGGKLKMNGVKYFGDCPPETALSYAASVIQASGSGLTGVFETQLSARNGRKYPVSNLKTYDAGGVSGEIGMDSVLVGSLRFMQSMGVDMPRGTRVSQAVYVAVNNELAGVFAISYGVTRAAAMALGALTRCKGITPVMATRDFMLTQTFLRAKFRVDASTISFPPMAARAELGQRRASADAPQAVLLTQEGFVPAASAVIGARSLHRCTLLGVLAVVFSGLSGMIIASVLAALGATALLGVGNLLKYMALWAVPCFLLSMWTKFS